MKNAINVEIFVHFLRISHFILIFSRLNHFNIQMNISKKTSQCLLSNDILIVRRKWFHYHEKRNQSRKICEIFACQLRCDRSKAKKSYSFIIFGNGGLPDSTCSLLIHFFFLTRKPFAFLPMLDLYAG
jgi:hypothetical protein